MSDVHDSDDSHDDDEKDDVNGEGSDSLTRGLTQPEVCPCPLHPEKMAESFCGKCQQLACEKCVSILHRRCQQVSSVSDAVTANRDAIDHAHLLLADTLVQAQMSQESHRDRLQVIQAMRTAALTEIHSQRQALVELILEKEKLLVGELNSRLDSLAAVCEASVKSAGQMAESLSAQLNVLDLSLSAKGQGELLSYLPTLCNSLKQMPDLTVPDDAKVEYEQNHACVEDIRPLSLGEIKVTGATTTDEPVQNGSKTSGDPIVTLTPVIAFHGGCRDDTVDPLLTDLLLLPNGDVIVTDRDNKCVKKFNQAGKLLTRVLVEAVPSRIAPVSHSRAVVSAMNKKSLYFLSLQGTVRILNSVKVKKIYSFLTSVARGVLAAGTSQCDVIDLLTEKGQLLRQLYAQKPDRALISRPLYLTTVTPDFKHHLSLANNNNNNNNNNNTVGNNNIKSTTTTNNNPGVNKNKTNTNNKTGKNDLPNGTQRRQSSTKPSDVDSVTSAPDVKIPDLLVSDSGKRMVFKLSPETGEVSATLRCSDEVSLQCPLGLAVHESGQTLLVDRDSDCVLQLDQDNQVKAKPLTSQSGVSKPCAIYAGHRGQVALTQVDGMVKIYLSQVTYS